MGNSELIINPDGSIYHLKLRPEHLADTVIVVGDPGRVEAISSHFDQIELKISNRELNTHTGRIGRKRISVLSTGMGTDNIDIVMNELDALANIDFNSGIPNAQHRTLDIIRLGTAGAIQPDIDVKDTFVVAEMGLGLDGLSAFYEFEPDDEEREYLQQFIAQTSYPESLPKPYMVKGSNELLAMADAGFLRGITVTAPGFYGPQGRVLRIPLRYPELNEKISDFSYNGTRILNFEMETSALYCLGGLLGHRMLTICTIIANRVTQQFNSNYKASVDKMISKTLEMLQL